MFDNLKFPDSFEIVFTPLDADKRGGNRGQYEKEMERLVVETRFKEGITLTHRQDGSPVAEGLGKEISVTHCKDWLAVAAWNGDRFGIDLEHLRTKSLKNVKSRFLSPREQKIYDTPFLWLRAWTMKEAVYKAAGIFGLNYADSIILPQKKTSPAVAIVKTIETTKKFTLYFDRVDTLALCVALPKD